MLPRHLNCPFTMMANLVHRASHSSILRGRRGREGEGEGEGGGEGERVSERGGEGRGREGGRGRR